MEERRQLIIDLKKLKQDWLQSQNEASSALDEKNLEIFGKKSIESGRKIIQFYNNVFLQKYFKSLDKKIEKVGYILQCYSFLAERAIENEYYLKLNTLFTSKDCSKGLNKLEVMIQDLELN